MAFLFTGVGKNDPAGVYLDGSNGIHLIATGAVEIAAEFGEEFEDPGIGVALDGIERSKRHFEEKGLDDQVKRREAEADLVLSSLF